MCLGVVVLWAPVETWAAEVSQAREVAPPPGDRGELLFEVPMTPAQGPRPGGVPQVSAAGASRSGSRSGESVGVQRPVPAPTERSRAGAAMSASRADARSPTETARSAGAASKVSQQRDKSQAKVSAKMATKMADKSSAKVAVQPSTKASTQSTAQRDRVSSLPAKVAHREGRVGERAPAKRKVQSALLGQGAQKKRGQAAASASRAQVPSARPGRAPARSAPPASRVSRETPPGVTQKSKAKIRDQTVGKRAPHTKKPVRPPSR